MTGSGWKRPARPRRREMMLGLADLTSPSIIRVSHRAAWLYLVGIAWATEQDQGRFVHRLVIGFARVDNRAADELVDAQLWREVDGGWDYALDLELPNDVRMGVRR